MHPLVAFRGGLGQRQGTAVVFSEFVDLMDRTPVEVRQRLATLQYLSAAVLIGQPDEELLPRLILLLGGGRIEEEEERRGDEKDVHHSIAAREEEERLERRRVLSFPVSWLRVNEKDMR